MDSAVKFYLILVKEFFLLPVLMFKEFFLKRISSFFLNNKPVLTQRKVADSELLVCIHDWGGYLPQRSKTLKSGKTFQCGLKYQLQRFEDYEGEFSVKVKITISDKKLSSISFENKNIIEVSNKGYDFSGYAAFLTQIPIDKNPYVLLMNSSVASPQVDFIDSYIRFMKKHPSVGLLGVSYSTKMFQTLVRNNFKPHVQSFFLLTTAEILREVVIKNNGNFPGNGCTHKLLLIREGEVLLSQLVLKLGYSLALVLADNKPHIIFKRHQLDNCYAGWKMPMGDYRQTIETPNCINPLL